MAQKKILSQHKAALLLGLSDTAVSRYFAAGILPSIPTGGAPAIPLDLLETVIERAAFRGRSAIR